jgi:hypothetical protein
MKARAFEGIWGGIVVLYKRPSLRLLGLYLHPYIHDWGLLISSAFGMERGEVFYGPTDWLGSRDPMTHDDYAPDSYSGLVTDDWLTDMRVMLTVR